MPKRTLAASARTMPETLSTRRTALTTILGASALAVGVGAMSPASADDSDAALIDLLDGWKAARARLKAADDRFDNADEASYVEPPVSLIRTKEDRDLFLFDKEPIGIPFRSKQSIAQLSFIVSVFLKAGLSGTNIERMCSKAPWHPRPGRNP